MSRRFACECIDRLTYRFTYRLASTREELPIPIAIERIAMKPKPTLHLTKPRLSSAVEQVVRVPPIQIRLGGEQGVRVLFHPQPTVSFKRRHRLGAAN